MGDEEETLLIDHRAKNGEILVFDITSSTMLQYGFSYADRVTTPRGPATVVGVRDGCLWFHIDGDSGASFWDNGKSFIDLRKIGIHPLDSTPMVIDLTEKNGVYKLKRVSYKDKNINVILQNENGPCPLISISNVLALRGDITITGGEGDASRAIDIDVIRVLLSDLLSQKHSEASEDTKKQVQKAIDQLPNLQTGMDVNFGFVQPDSFEKSDQSLLFELLGVRLVHGWLVDPIDAETHAVIGGNTYNDLMNKLVALDQPNPNSANSVNSVNSSISSISVNSVSPPPSLSSSASSVNTPSSTTPSSSDPLPPSSSADAVSSSSLSSSPTANVSLANETPSPSSANLPAVSIIASSPKPVHSPQRHSSSNSLSNSQSENQVEQKKPEEVKPPTARDYYEGDVINSFLRQTSSQLTAHGLNVLLNAIKEGELCVFFRNNHFSTITRHESQLYILVTDIGYEKERIIVWDLLNSVDGTSIFVTGDFKPTDDEKKDEIVNTLELMGWPRPKVEECYKEAPSDKLVNVDDAILYLAQMLGPLT